MNFSIIILPTWASLKGWLPNSIFWKRAFFMPILCFTTCKMGKFHQVSNKLQSIPISGISALKPVISKNTYLNLSSKTWKLISNTKILTTKWAKSSITSPSRTFKRATNFKLPKNHLTSLNLHIDRLPRIFLSQFIKIRRLMLT